MPCEDNNNQELETGSKVIITGEVVSITTQGNYCIVSVKVTELGDGDVVLDFRSGEVSKGAVSFDPTITGVVSGDTG